jgi:hypothetical protein
MDLDAFGEEAFTAALAASRQGGASGFSAHAGTEPVLVLAGAFGALKGAFHIGTSAAGGQRIGAGRLGREERLSTGRWELVAASPSVRTGRWERKADNGKLKLGKGREDDHD